MEQKYDELIATQKKMYEDVILFQQKLHEENLRLILNVRYGSEKNTVSSEKTSSEKLVKTLPKKTNDIQFTLIGWSQIEKTDNVYDLLNLRDLELLYDQDHELHVTFVNSKEFIRYCKKHFNFENKKGKLCLVGYRKRMTDEKDLFMLANFRKTSDKLYIVSDDIKSIYHRCDEFKKYFKKFSEFRTYLENFTGRKFELHEKRKMNILYGWEIIGNRIEDADPDVINDLELELE
jgi:hypothetical protein